MKLRIAILRAVKWLICGCELGDSRIWHRLWIRVCQQIYDDLDRLNHAKTEGTW
jgi:hypothetical protein